MKLLLNVSLCKYIFYINTIIYKIKEIYYKCNNKIFILYYYNNK